MQAAVRRRSSARVDMAPQTHLCSGWAWSSGPWPRPMPGAVAMARRTYSRARSTASSMARPCAARRRSPRPGCSRCRGYAGSRSALAPDAMPRFGRQHVVHRIAGEMPALQQHRAAAERQQRVGRLMHRRRRSRCVRPARISASGRFGVSTAARGTNRRFKRVDRRRLDQRRAAFRDHDRIDHQRHLRRPLGE